MRLGGDDDGPMPGAESIPEELGDRLIEEVFAVVELNGVRRPAGGCRSGAPARTAEWGIAIGDRHVVWREDLSKAYAALTRRFAPPYPASGEGYSMPFSRVSGRRCPKGG